MERYDIERIATVLGVQADQVPIRAIELATDLLTMKARLGLHSLLKEDAIMVAFLYKAETTSVPQYEDESEPGVVKRGPGRPRKNPVAENV